MIEDVKVDIVCSSKPQHKSCYQACWLLSLSPSQRLSFYTYKRGSHIDVYSDFRFVRDNICTTWQITADFQ